MVNPLESSTVQQNGESLIPPDVVGSKEKPYEPIGGTNVHTVIRNMWYLASKLEVGNAYFTFCDKQYSVDGNFEVNLIKECERVETKNLDKNDALNLTQMREWATEVKNKIKEN